MIFQSVVIACSFLLIIYTISRGRAHILSPFGAFFWILFWIGLAGVVSLPDMTQQVADMIGIGRGVDVVIYGSIALVFFIVFKLHIKIERMRRDLTALARGQALKEVLDERVDKPFNKA